MTQKKADFAPIFYQGKKEHPGNYRLVSRISVPGKVMDQIHSINSFWTFHLINSFQWLLLSEMPWGS